MPCEKKPEMSEDEGECNRKLGKEPPKPQFDGLVIGEDLVKRLETGIIDEERNTSYDDYWREKLACMDSAHTDRYNLTIEDAETSMRNIQKYLKITEPKHAPINFTEVKSCIEMFKGQELRCSDQIQDFISTVDRVMYEAVRPSNKDFLNSKKKMTYAEKFEKTL